MNVYRHSLTATALLISAFALQASDVRAANLITNGDYHADASGFTGDYSFVASGPSTSPGTFGVRSSPTDFNSVYASFGDHTGNGGKMMLIDGSGTTGAVVWKETIPVVPGASYALSSWAASTNGANPAVLRFFINSVQVGSDTTLPSTTGQWQNFSATWNADSNSTAVITIVDVNPQPLGYGNDFALDDLSFTGAAPDVQNAQALTFGKAASGSIANAGLASEWTITGSQGKSLSVIVDPNPTSSTTPLHWTNVQVYDSSGNLLADESNGSINSLVVIANISLPADGTYRIRFNSDTGHPSSTGAYTITALDGTPNRYSLNLGQNSVGSITVPTRSDQWNFSADQGQQISLKVVGVSSSSLVFGLQGPNGYQAFQNLRGNSGLINLPTSGAYTLTVTGQNASTGSYNFILEATSLTPLASGTPYNGTWAGTGQAQLFAIQVTAANPLSVALSDMVRSNHSELYARFGAAPTRETYDYAANGAGSSQSLLVPSAKVGTWYVLVYGESIPSFSGNYLLQANSSEVVLSHNSTSQGVANLDTTITLTGAGFTSGSRVSLIGGNGTAYAAISSTTDLATQITATFAANSVPAGTYGIRVTQPDGTSTDLPSSIIIAATGKGVLQTHLTIPNPIGRHIASTLYVTYSNVGNAAMPAPLLNVDATNPSGVEGAFLTLDPALITQGFWTSATPLGYSQSVQILASGATPGVLQPGESVQVPIYYGGWINNLWATSGTFNFHVSPVEADDATPVNWASLESTTKPTSIDPTAWHIIYANLLSQLGTTSGGYVQLLDKNAIYLGQLGRNVTDISKLWGFAITQALGVFPTQDLAGTTDDSLPTVGKLFLSFGRSFKNSIPGRFQAGPLGLGWVTPWQHSLSVASDGTVTIALGNGSKSMYQPDSRYPGRYFSQAGDHSVLTAASGAYQLTAVYGTIATFASTGQLSYLQDPNGNKITAVYSGSKLTGVTASSGASFTFAYNGAGLISTLTDSAGRVTKYTYDTANQHLLSVLSYNGLTTSYGYDTTTGSASLNALKTINLPSGLQENLTYDGSGRITGITANGGAVPKTVAYSAGQVSITDSTPATSSVYFDENGQLAKTVDALGNPTFFGHDSSYNLTSVTNALGISATYAYNNIGAVTAATDFLGNTTNLLYGGPQNQLTKLTDAKGNVTSYSYNPTGQRTGTTFANGNSESSTFDPLGNALSFVNAASEPIQYVHYANGQLKSATFADGSSYAYVYDGEGHLTSATDTSGSVTFTYDPVTRLLSKVTYPNGLWLQFTYDANARRSSMTDQTGFTTTYIYDGLSHLSALKDGSGNVIVSYGYDGNGRLNQKGNSNGTYTTYSYYPNGQVQHLVNYAPGGAVNSRFDDIYNSLGLKTGETTLNGTWTYTYDANGQLIHAVFASVNPSKVANQDLAYNYDAMGSRTSTLINGVATAYVTNNMNQYSSIGGVAQSFDAKGNLLSDGSNVFTYSVLNKVLSVSNGSGATAYAYNSLGQRTSQSDASGSSLNLPDPSSLNATIGRFDSQGNIIEHYLSGFGLTAEVIGTARFFFDFDTVGNTAGLSNSAGAYVDSYSYRPFGDLMNSSLTVPNSFEFGGEVGVQTNQPLLHSMGVRFETSATGRFNSPDPAGLLGGEVNLQLYAHNNPVQFVDPSGLLSSETGFLLLDIIGGAKDGFGAGVLSFQGKNNEALGGALGSLVGDAIGDALIPETGPLGFAIGAVLSYGLGELGGYIGEQLDKSDDAPYIPFSFNPPPNGGDNNNGDGSDNNGGLPGFPFPFPLPDSDPFGPFPLPGFPIPPGPGDPTYPGQPTDPNGLYGPSGYGAANFVTNMGNAFAYRVTFENDPKASAPAQIVTITDNLSSSLDWTTFRLTGIGFADNNLVVLPGSQHYQTTVQMTYNGQTFNVQIETGIHGDTGQVYATFTSIDPNTSLPPSNVLTGFLPPEDGTGRGEGYLTYTVSPTSSVSNAAVIRNVAYITFDGNQPIATNQVDDEDPSKGTDPTKEAPVTIDSTVPTAHITALPSLTSPNIAVSWTGSDVGGSGIGSYTVYVSSDGGHTYTAWLTNTKTTSGVYPGLAGHSYSFYVVATSNVGAVQSLADAQAGTVRTTVENVPQITSAAATEVVEGQPFMYQITATNAPTSYGASGLPPGQSVNATNGAITGVATQSGLFTVIVSATNVGGTGMANLALTVDPASNLFPAITSAASASVVLGQPFSYQITATNAPTSFGATGLPLGLSVDGSSGFISGVPTQMGVFNIGLSATNGDGIGTAALALTVTAPPPPAPTPTPTPPPPLVQIPVIDSVLAANGQAKVAFSYQITATNNAVSFSADGLPDGLSVDSTMGLISGTPSVAGVYPITLSASNSAGSGTAELVLTIAAAPLPTVTLKANAAQVTAGSGSVVKLTLELSEPQTTDVKVILAIKGSAINGTDYVFLKSKQKIKAGQTKLKVKLIPVGDLGGEAKKTVKLTLESGEGYTIGTSTPVKVKILSP